jgi:hypothetical protein
VQAHTIAQRVWAKPAETLSDVLLRGEIALRRPDDQRASDELIRAVITVLGGKPRIPSNAAPPADLRSNLLRSRCEPGCGDL